MNGKFNEDIDNKIADCLNYKAEEVSAPDDMLFKIKTDIRNNNRSRNGNKKVKFLKFKTIIAIGILCVVITVPVAAKKVNLRWFSAQNEIESAINQFPTADIVEKTLGYLPKYTENLHSEFKFKSFNISDNCAQDRTGNKVINTKVGEFKYTKDGVSGNQELEMTVTKIDKQSFDERVENMGYYYDDTIKYYNWIVHKEVPKDYVETKDDLKFIKQGIMDINYGSNEINIYSVNYVLWYEDGIQYMITNKAYKEISIPDLLSMADAVIRK